MRFREEQLTTVSREATVPGLRNYEEKKSIPLAFLSVAGNGLTMLLSEDKNIVERRRRL